MKSEQECEKAAKESLQAYVNGCQCNSEDDAQKALNKMLAMTIRAKNLLAYGKKETVQQPPPPSGLEGSEI